MLTNAINLSQAPATMSMPNGPYGKTALHWLDITHNSNHKEQENELRKGWAKATTS